MNVKKVRNIVLIVLAACFIGLTVFGYVIYNKQVKQSQLLEKDLAETKDTLRKAKHIVSQVNQEKSSLAKQNNDLSSEISDLTEKLAAIEQEKDDLDQKISVLLNEKENLETQMAQVTAEIKESSQREQGFQEQLRAQEQKLENLTEQNQRNLTQLEDSKQMLDEVFAVSKELLSELEKTKQEKQALRQFPAGDVVQLSEQGPVKDEQALKTHYNQALAYEEKEKYKKALKEYKKALEVAPDDPDTHYNLALLYDERLKKTALAIKHYQTYLKLMPDAADAAKVAKWLKQAEENLFWEHRSN
ncbi:tetratricopeptide repeat protein [Candidatus Omnitrophota bacterium]